MVLHRVTFATIDMSITKKSEIIIVIMNHVKDILYIRSLGEVNKIAFLLKNNLS